MALKSIQTHVSDGTLQSVQFSIAFLNTSHLHFYVDDVEITTSIPSQGVAVDGVDEYGVTLTAAVPSGAVFKVQRQTPRDNVPHVFATGAALFTALTTDANNEYLLYVVQETYEQSGQGPFPEINELIGTEYVIVDVGGTRKQITVQNFLASVASTASLTLDLANDTDPAKGVGMIGTTPGRTQRDKNTDVLSVDDFSHLVSGGDWAAAISAAIAKANGSRVILTRGQDYSVSALYIPSNTILDWNGATISQKSGMSNTPIINVGDNVTDVTNVKLLNVKINGNKLNVTGNAAHGIGINKASNVLITNPVFEQVRRIGLYCYDVRGLTISGLTVGIDCGTTGAIGSAVQMLNCKNVKCGPIKASGIAGVGALFQGFEGLNIDFFEASSITVDNGVTFDTGKDLFLGGYNIDGCFNQGLELNSTDGVYIGPGKSINNGACGLLVSTYTGGTESPVKNAKIYSPKTSGNATEGVRLVGAQNCDIFAPSISDGLLLTNSAGGVVLGKVKISGGDIDAITSSSGDGVVLDDVTTASLSVPGGKVSVTKSENPRCDTGRVIVANGSFVDMAIPRNVAGDFGGTLVVSSCFSGNYGQNSTVQYLVNTSGSTQIIEVSNNSSAIPRKVTASIAGTGIRLTNSTGVECVVSATFVGNAL